MRIRRRFNICLLALAIATIGHACATGNDDPTSNERGSNSTATSAPGSYGSNTGNTSPPQDAWQVDSAEFRKALSAAAKSADTCAVVTTLIDGYASLATFPEQKAEYLRVLDHAGTIVPAELQSPLDVVASWLQQESTSGKAPAEVVEAYTAVRDWSLKCA